jgi:hypothetical protein
VVRHADLRDKRERERMRDEREKERKEGEDRICM